MYFTEAGNTRSERYAPRDLGPDYASVHVVHRHVVFGPDSSPDEKKRARFSRMQILKRKRLMKRDIG